MQVELAQPTFAERAAAYRGIRQRVRALVEATEATGGGALDTRCPATPEWRARDLVAHLVGVPADVLAGRLDGVATDAWTGAQVDARRDTPIATMLDEWDVDGPAVEAILEHFPDDRAGQMVYDATTHEHDLRHALGAPGAQDSDAVLQSFAWLVTVAGPARDDALRLQTEAGDVVIGSGEPVATIAMSRFEYIRAAAGRRSPDQVAAYDWNGADPQPELLLAAPIFKLAATDLV